jgi:HptB-dependent secretion and biofilm anti anti-sigma factor
MECNLSLSPTGAFVTLRGNFTFSDHAAFKSMLSELEKNRGQPVTISLAEVSYVDSAAMGMLLLLRDKLTPPGQLCSISLAGACGMVKKVLHLSNFDQLFIMRD